MNKTSHTDEPLLGNNGYNQSPNPNSSDLITNAGFNSLVNSQAMRPSNSKMQPDTAFNNPEQIASDKPIKSDGHNQATYRLANRSVNHGQPSGGSLQISTPANLPPALASGDADRGMLLKHLKGMLAAIRSFIRPGFIISVAYSI